MENVHQQLAALKASLTSQTERLHYLNLDNRSQREKRQLRNSIAMLNSKINGLQKTINDINQQSFSFGGLY